MFLAADPLERLAADGRFGAAPSIAASAFAFAAAWRHGMAGNSPLYMPGFFVVAGASWVWAETAGRRAIVSFPASLSAALALAWMAAIPGASGVVSGFERSAGLAVDTALPLPHWGAAAAGLYTLLTWTAFVVGARLSLGRRSLTPLAPVPVLTAGLVVVRPWTVGDFTATWGTRAIEGDVVALVSLGMIPALAIVLVQRERSRRARGR